MLTVQMLAQSLKHALKTRPLVMQRCTLWLARTVTITYWTVSNQESDRTADGARPTML